MASSVSQDLSDFSFDTTFNCTLARITAISTPSCIVCIIAQDPGAYASGCDDDRTSLSAFVSTVRSFQNG